MKIITGERLQDLADISFARKSDFGFQSKTKPLYDIENFNFDNFNNPEVVYCNSGLINTDKPILANVKLYDKLKKFQNPFDLILHNSDQNFDDEHLRYFEIKNIKRIFTQNINTHHERLFSFPIGIANSVWKWGDLDTVEKHMNSLPKNKSNNIYFNFQVNGGWREEFRPQCYTAMIDKGIEFLPNTDFDSYLDKLKTYKYCISPEGNGIDCYRMYEALYLKVVPICHRNLLTEYYSNIFPIILLDDWNDLDFKMLDNYQPDWSNYHLLDMDNYLNHIKYYG